MTTVDESPAYSQNLATTVNICSISTLTDAAQQIAGKNSFCTRYSSEHITPYKKQTNDL